MKIVLYSETFLPDLGGLERNSYTLAITLKKLKHDVVLLTGTLNECSEVLPFPVIRTKSINDIIRNFQKADCVIVNGGISIKACLPAFFLRRKYLVIYQMSTLYYSERSDIKSALKERLSKFLAAKALINITVSEYARTNLRLKNILTATLINPLDEQLWMLSAKVARLPKKYDILFAGRMIEGKGIFILAEAYKKLLKKNMQLTIAFAGDGEDEEIFKKYIQNNQLPVIFLGRLDKISLLEAYVSSKILVVPSSTHIEGSPLVIAESISLGTPVIASNQPAMIEIVGKAGVIFNSGDAENLAEKLYDIFQNDSVLNELILQCENEKDKFSYQKYVENVSRILSVAGNH